MVVPGFTTNDASTIPLRAYLGGLGYECRGWGLGVNSGDLQTQLPQTIKRVAAWSAERDEAISLVGWSLGGVIAREVARVRPDIVERVITFGTPLWGPRHTTTTMARRADLPGIEERLLAVDGLGHACRDRGCGLRLLEVGTHRAGGHRPHRALQVDAVADRPGDAVAVAPQGVGRTLALRVSAGGAAARDQQQCQPVLQHPAP